MTVLPRLSRAMAVAVAVVLAFAAALVGATPAQAATHTVTKNLDDGSLGTLSYALSNLDAVGGNTVTIATPGPIVMTTGLPTIFDDVDIIGPAGGVTIVMASALGGFVTDAAAVTMQDLDIRSDVPGSGVGLEAIDTDLTLTRVSVREFDLNLFHVGTGPAAVSLTDVEVGGLDALTPSTLGVRIQSNGGTVALTRVLATYTNGLGVLVEANGAIVDLDTVTVEDDAGGGFLLQGTASTITADRVTVTRTAGGFTAFLDSSRLDMTALTATGTTGLGVSVLADNGSAVTVTGASISGSDDSGVSFTLRDSTITASDIESFDNGQVPGCGCGGSGSGIEIEANDSTVALIRAHSHDNAAEFGGGIYIAEVSNGATVTVTNATIADNHATDDGGGIYVEGVVDDGSSLSINDSAITLNSSGDQGAGIYLHEVGNAAVSTAKVTITRTTVDDNSASGYGAGIAIWDPASETSGLPTVLIDSSTLSNNTTPVGGGGIYVGKVSAPGPAVLSVLNSTISGNSAQGGGGIYTETSSPGFPLLALLVSNSTITDNRANTTGGLERNGGDQELKVDNSIIADNDGTFDLDAGAPYTVAFSLIQNPGPGVVLPANNIVGVSPQLGALALNGGTTRTHLVTPNTPAYNAGNPAFVGAGLLDQRGQARVFERLDMGAVEWHPALADTGSTPPEPEAPLIALLFVLTGVAMVAFSQLRTARSVG